MKLRYKVDNFLLCVEISAARSCKVVSEKPFAIHFQWEYHDPYFGFMATWDTKGNKDVWVSPALRSYCEPPENHDVLNNSARAYSNKQGLEVVIAKVFQEWKKYHVDKKLVQIQLQQLKHQR